MIKINYEGKLFVPEQNTENGEVDVIPCLNIIRRDVFYMQIIMAATS